MRTTLQMVAAAAATIAGLIAVGSAGPAAAAPSAGAATGPGSEEFTLAPAPAANGAARPYFMLTIAPGDSAEDVAVFGNGGSTEREFRVGVADGATAANSGSAYGGAAGHCAGPACWVAGLPPTVTLEPHTQEEVRFRVAVPARTRPGQYLAGITAAPAQTPKPVTLRSNGRDSTKVVIVNRVIIGVAVTVGPLSALRTRVKVTGVTAGWIDGIVRLGVDVRNDGQRFTKGAGHLTCTVDGARLRYPVTMGTVLPGDAAALQVNGNGMRTGTWPCTVRIKDSGGGTDTWSGDVTVPASVAAATKRIGNDDYVAPSGVGIPAWAIVLIVLAGLILFSIWALILRRSHDKKLDNPTDG